MIDGGVNPLNLLLVGINGPRNSSRIILGMLGQCLAITWSFLGMKSHSRDLGMNSHSFLF